MGFDLDFFKERINDENFFKDLIVLNDNLTALNKSLGNKEEILELLEALKESDCDNPLSLKIIEEIENLLVSKSDEEEIV